MQLFHKGTEQKPEESAMQYTNTSAQFIKSYCLSVRTRSFNYMYLTNFEQTFSPSYIQRLTVSPFCWGGLTVTAVSLIPSAAERVVNSVGLQFVSSFE